MDNRKSVRIKYDDWRRLRKLAYEKDKSLQDVLDELLKKCLEKVSEK